MAAVGCPCRTCRARDVLDRVGDKWSVDVIELLGADTRRFTELVRGIHGISQRMLTVTLRGLERDGIVTRTVHAAVPPRVDYALTPMGRTLLDTIRELKAWGRTGIRPRSMPRASATTNSAPTSPRCKTRQATVDQPQAAFRRASAS